MRLINKLLIGSVLALGMGAEAGTAEIRIRERAVLTTSVVYLADVAEIEAADGERDKLLTGLPLMPAPAPGTQRYLRRREIADLLAAHGVDLSSVRFEGADQVAITSQADGWAKSHTPAATASGASLNRHAALLAGQIVKRNTSPAPNLEHDRTDELRTELNHLIASHLKSKVGEAASWSVSCDVPRRQLGPLGRCSSTPACQGGNPPWTGRQRFVVSFGTPEGDVQLPVYAEVGVTSKPVVVAVQPLGRGETITAAHVELRSLDYLPQPNGRGAVVGSIEELIGMEARQAIRAGEAVYSDQVQPPLLVKRGDLISVSSHAGGIRVRTTARAREDGARGAVVQVESLDKRERFDARVVGPRAAAVFAVARMQTAQRETTTK